MIRRLALDIMLFFLPFIAYLLYVRLVPASVPKADRVTPWTRLTVAGLVLVIASFVWLGLTDANRARGLYVPAHLENGQVIAGHIAPGPGSRAP